ncbi:MAG: carboxylate-amine ligase [Acidobacteria bacterium]|nr:MAG: carboxylate-amine ligase [Acidobacteriota bacterium]
MNDASTLDVLGPSPAGDEARAFARLQARLPALFRRVFPDPLAPRTVVVVPSLTMDAELLAKIEGVQHYEERLLCMLMLLRLPHTHVIYLTSLPVDPTIVDYYLHLLPGIPSNHARRRLTLLAAHDGSPTPLTRKILDRPRLLRRIRSAIPDPETAHLSCFTVTEEERALALALDVPLYGCDPALADAGSKSGSREILKQAGVPVPDGFERLRDARDVVAALAALKRRNPALRRAVIKLEEGTSGEGNAIFAFDGCPAGGGLERWLETELPRRLRFEAEEETWERYRERFADMGGIVETFVEGEPKRSPSVQCRIDPLGGIDLISTHDQELGGRSGQVFKGCTFPADPAYRLDVQAAGARAAELLRQRGILGRFAIDFVSVREGDGWRHYGIEINLRKGGTTHTFMMLQFLTDGTYDPSTGLYRTPTGQERFYYASDNLKSPRYRGLTPEDLIDIAVDHDLHFHGATQQGVVFHLIGALSEHGKLGVLCVAGSVGEARDLYRHAVDVLDRETEA